MKKVICALCFSIFVIFTLAYANPPKDIEITYNIKTKTLLAVITHPTNNPVRHFIKKVDIGLNGEEIATLDFSKQANNITQTLEYKTKDVKAGDSLSVEAYCSISGKLEKEITVRNE